MWSLRKINPMVRAVGTMGAVAALVGGITFADLNSNQVALTNNTLVSATAQLQIGSNAEAFNNNSVAGMNSTLTPGVPSSFTFFLKNNGQAPLNITASVPTSGNNSDIPYSDITLSFDCGNGPVTFTLDAWAAGSAAIPGNPLGSNATWTCSETATLASSYSGQGGQSVKAFKVNFVGNQVAVVNNQ